MGTGRRGNSAGPPRCCNRRKTITPLLRRRVTAMDEAQTSRAPPAGQAFIPAKQRRVAPEPAAFGGCELPRAAGTPRRALPPRDRRLSQRLQPRSTASSPGTGTTGRTTTSSCSQADSASSSATATSSCRKAGCSASHGARHRPKADEDTCCSSSRRGAQHGRCTRRAERAGARHTSRPRAPIPPRHPTGCPRLRATRPAR
jgi:hypothetical protein